MQNNPLSSLAAQNVQESNNQTLPVQSSSNSKTPPLFDSSSLASAAILTSSRPSCSSSTANLQGHHSYQGHERPDSNLQQPRSFCSQSAKLHQPESENAISVTQSCDSKMDKHVLHAQSEQEHFCANLNSFPTTFPTQNADDVAFVSSDVNVSSSMRSAIQNRGGGSSEFQCFAPNSSEVRVDLSYVPESTEQPEDQKIATELKCYVSQV